MNIVFLHLNIYSTKYYFEGNLTKCAFDSQRLFLWKACGIAKPSDDQQSNLLKPVSDKIESILVDR